MKKLFKKKLIREVPEPRELKELEERYSELLGKSGTAQYLIYVNQQELDRLNQEMLRVNQEAAARKALDAEKAKEAKDEAKNETN